MMKLTLGLLAILCSICICDARPARVWTYQDLVKESDLVVIATPVSSEDVKTPVEVPNMARADDKGNRTPVMAVGVETKFLVDAVLKGDQKELKEFVLYHLREPDKSVPVPNGPMFATFKLQSPPIRYLLFLKKEADGRYVSVTGQTDSSEGVKDLGGHP